MTRNFTASLGVIIHAPEVIAIWHGRERAVQRKNLQTMSRQIELANNLRTQQRDDVRTNRKLKTRKHFFRHGGSAKHMTPFEHEHFLSGPCKICGINQTVVSAANNYDVVVVLHDWEWFSIALRLSALT
jgi:hypothetical protein